MAPSLYDPAEHRPLVSGAWSETRARAALETIACDAIDAYEGPERLWPNASDDLDGEPDVPYRNAYLGAAGVAWALDLLAKGEFCPELPGLGALADILPDGFRRAPEFIDLAPAPAPSLLFGESGILLAVDDIRQTGEHLDDLEACVRRNARNPALEMCWGSPGTMLAALALWRRTGETRWRDAWLDSANWLLDEWRESVWIQDLYGQKRRFTGAAHGFASNAFVLLAGKDLLGDRAGHVTDRIRDVFRELAVVQDGAAQWLPYADDATGRRPLQWCHGSPGMITSLSGLPADQETDRLLAAGGELTWRAGPLRKGVGLCHGTAGNAYALLALHARLGDVRWLHRAQMFAMDAPTTSTGAARRAAVAATRCSPETSASRSCCAAASKPKPHSLSSRWANRDVIDPESPRSSHDEHARRPIDSRRRSPGSTGRLATRRGRGRRCRPYRHPALGSGVLRPRRRCL